MPGGECDAQTPITLLVIQGIWRRENGAPSGKERGTESKPKKKYKTVSLDSEV